MQLEVSGLYVLTASASYGVDVLVRLMNAREFSRACIAADGATYSGIPRQQRAKTAATGT